jgi:hypothetical protein
MKGVYALYPSPAAAQRAFEQLKSAGVNERHIVVLSSEPHEEYEFAHRDKKSWMTWIAALGGFIGMATGYLLTAITQNLWKINTGGMPIVTNWTNLIVIFELTMLGVVFASVITLLVTARLPGRMPKMYDPEIADGKILIGVAGAREAATPDVERALRAGGARHLKTIG